jgi:hypothetical protein
MGIHGTCLDFGALLVVRLLLLDAAADPLRATLLMASSSAANVEAPRCQGRSPEARVVFPSCDRES